MLLTGLKGLVPEEEERGGDKRGKEKGGAREGRGGKSLCAGLPSPTTILRSNNQLCK